MGAIKREMGGFNKWFWAAIGWECCFAYAIALIIFQVGRLAVTGTFDVWTIVAFALIGLILFGLFRPANGAQLTVLKPAIAQAQA
jgi:ferrous iron transport protein B